MNDIINKAFAWKAGVLSVLILLVCSVVSLAQKTQVTLTSTQTTEVVCAPKDILVTADFTAGEFYNVMWSSNHGAVTVIQDPLYDNRATARWNYSTNDPVVITVHADNLNDPDNGGDKLAIKHFNGSVTFILTSGPSVTDDKKCPAETRPFLLKANGGSQVLVNSQYPDGYYKWYSSLSGGSPIAGVTGSTYSPSVSVSTTFYVSFINISGCESQRVPVKAIIEPVIRVDETFENVTQSNYTSYFTTDYPYSSTAQLGTISIKSIVCSTSSYGNFLMVDAATATSTDISVVKKPWRKTVNVTQGYLYDFSAEFKRNPLGYSGSTDYAPVYLLINGQKIPDGAGGYVNTVLVNNTSCDAWNKVSTKWRATSTGTIELSFAMHPVNDGTKGYDFGADNIRFQLAPPIVSTVNDPAVSQSMVMVCPGEPVTLYAFNSPTSIYQWFVKEGVDWVVIPEATSNTLHIPSASSKEYAVSYKEGSCITSAMTSIRVILHVVNSPKPVIKDTKGTSTTTIDNNITYYLAKVGETVNLELDNLHASSFQIYWGEGSPVTVQSTSSTLSKTLVPHVFSAKRNYEITVTSTSISGCTRTASIWVRTYNVICETALPTLQLASARDKVSGAYFLISDSDGNCESKFLFDCFSTKGEEVPNVVSTSFISYGMPDVKAGVGVVSNPFQEGLKRLRPVTVSSYSTDDVTTGDNYNAGTFSVHTPFNWYRKADGQQAAWVPGAKVTLVSKNGDILEEENAIGIKSAAKFGYHGALPYLVANNAEHEAIFFESFETSYSTSGTNVTLFEDALLINNSVAQVDATVAHAGRKSLKLQPSLSGSTLALTQLEATESITEKGVVISLWARVKSASSGTVLSAGDLPAGLFRTRLKNFTGGDIQTTPSDGVMQLVAQTGEWMLFQVHLLPGAILVSSTQSYLVPSIVSLGGYDIWLDDIRVQPADAQVTAYVYDEKDMKLLVSFDDQHFGLIYQYDSEGRLVRKRLETVRGIKTVQETQYNVPKVNQ